MIDVVWELGKKDLDIIWIFETVSPSHNQQTFLIPNLIEIPCQYNSSEI